MTSGCCAPTAIRNAVGLDDVLAATSSTSSWKWPSPGQPPGEDENFMQETRRSSPKTPKGSYPSCRASGATALRGQRLRGSTSHGDSSRPSRWTLLDQTIAITEAAHFKAADKHGTTAIDEVLLVGGSAKMPAVANRSRPNSAGAKLDELIWQLRRAWLFTPCSRTGAPAAGRRAATVRRTRLFRIRRGCREEISIRTGMP